MHEQLNITIRSEYGVVAGFHNFGFYNTNMMIYFYYNDDIHVNY